MGSPCSPVVYFIQAGLGGPIKIGYTARSGTRRLREVQTTHHEELILLVEALGSREDEGRLHALFRSHHVRGEWFANCRDIQDLIAYLQDGGSLRAYLDV